MKISIKTEGLVPVESLKSGDVFECLNNFYMKINSPKYDCIYVNLSNGNVTHFFGNDEVRHLPNANLVED